MDAYRKELLRSNLGSTVEIMTEMDGPVRRFKRMYICFQACKEGWMKGCMPLIRLDGCHIKGHHPRQLLTTIGIDADNKIFLIAYAMVERESKETWTSFLEYLQQDVKIERDSIYVFMTDKQKGLDNAFKATSTTILWFNKHMDEMKMVKDKAVDWFDDKNPSHWSRAFFKEETKCDILLNNLCESFNSSILPARDKLILAMLERIRMDMMVRNANKWVACEKCKVVVGPWIKNMLDKVGQRATQYIAHRGGEFIFQVTGFGENGNQHAVDLGLHTCTCKRWQLSGIPCVHAISCIKFKKQELTTQLHLLYITSCLERPKKKRIVSQGENGNPAPPAPTKGKLPETGVTMTCKLCGQQGHNRVGCPITKAKKAAEVVQRAPAPPKESRPIKDQVIKSKKGWKKMKLAMDGSSAGNGSGSASIQPSTQSSQNHVARGFTK
ncbi:hypothetical protein ACLB2K_063604 [Fragaria x ananassa]